MCFDVSVGIHPGRNGDKQASRRCKYTLQGCHHLSGSLRCVVRATSAYAGSRVGGCMTSHNRQQPQSNTVPPPEDSTTRKRSAPMPEDLLHVQHCRTTERPAPDGRAPGPGGGRARVRRAPPRALAALGLQSGAVRRWQPRLAIAQALAARGKHARVMGAQAWTAVAGGPNFRRAPACPQPPRPGRRPRSAPRCTAIDAAAGGQRGAGTAARAGRGGSARRGARAGSACCRGSQSRSPACRRVCDGRGWCEQVTAHCRPCRRPGRPGRQRVSW